MTLNKWFDNEENECLIMTEGLVKILRQNREVYYYQYLKSKKWKKRDITISL